MTSRGSQATLADRLALLQAARLAIAAIVAIGCVWAPGWLGASAATAVPVSLVYAALTTLAELARRRSGRRAVALVAGTLLVDGLYLALVGALGRGAGGLTVALIQLHVIAVTLLVSYRTGLKIALWHVLLAFVAYYVRAAATASGSPRLRDAAVLDAVVVLLVAVAAAAASSLNERELRRGHAEQSALAALAARLQEARRSGEVESVLLEEALPALGFRRGAVVTGEPGVMGERVREAAAARRAVLVRTLDARSDPDLAAALPGAANVVVVPLVADGEALGALALEWGGGPDARIPGRIVEATARFAAPVALALRNAALLAEVERLATTDGLTGLANRRVFDDALARELARAARAGTSCALVVVDVDHFKSVNDSHGHLAGDGVLHHVGQVLADACRDGDLAARYGGEEFAVILPGCSGRDASAAAERLRGALAEDPGPVPVTVSAGVAVFPVHASGAAALVAAADEALYRSKQAGRDRVSVSRRRPARPAVIAS